MKSMNKKELMSKLSNFLQRFGPAYAEWLQLHDAEVYENGFKKGAHARQKDMLINAGKKTYTLNGKYYQVVEFPKEKAFDWKKDKK
jgi:hypothetical protein